MLKSWFLILTSSSLIVSACGEASDGTESIDVATSREALGFPGAGGSAGAANGLMGVDVAAFDTVQAVWTLDLNQNGIRDAGEILAPNAFGVAGDIPVAFVVGTGGGGAPGAFGCDDPIIGTSLAVYRPSDKKFRVDSNGNRTLDASDMILPVNVSVPGYQIKRPFVRQVQSPAGSTTCKSQIGVFLTSASHVKWFIDANLDGVVASNEEWTQAFDFGVPADLPVPLLYGTGKTSVLAVWRTNTGEWFIDASANGGWEGCSTDRCVAAGVFGDNTQTGFASPFYKFIATYKNGEEFIDANMSYGWDHSPPDGDEHIGNNSVSIRVLGRY